MANVMYHGRRSRCAPNGWTLVELLTVIAIIGVIFSLTFVALGSSRESARQLSCKNNLRQISLSSTNYISSRNKLPFSRGAEGFLGLLPWLEQKELYEQIRMAARPEDFDRVPPLFQCPTDSIKNHYSNYLPCGGKRSENIEPKHRGFASRGVEALREVSDGLANTIFYSEQLIPAEVPNPMENRRRWLLLVNHHVETESEFDSLCLAQFGNNSQVQRGAGQLTSLSQFSTFGTVYPPNSPSCDVAASGMSPPELGLLRIYTANSLHPQCVNVAFGDGSISTVSNSVSTSVWFAQGTIAGRD